MSRPIQLDPANEKFFQLHAIAFHQSAQGCNYKNSIDPLLPEKTNENEPKYLQQSSVVIFKAGLQKR